MVNLKIHNDGKEKRQSFEAWVDGIDCEKGYGATEEDAVLEYERELKKHAMKLQVASQDITLGNYEKLKVDWGGKEI